MRVKRSATEFFPFLLFIPAFVIFLFGCASIAPWDTPYGQNFAGITKWKVTPVEVGDEVKYKIFVIDGKEKQDVLITATKNPDGTITVSYSAKGVEAFPGQALRAEVDKIVAEQIGKFSREVLPDIIKGVIGIP